MNTLNPLFQKLLDKILSHSVDEISVEEAHQSKKEFQFLDAREYDEFQVSHIEDAMHIGYKNFNDSAIQSIKKDTPLIVYCSVGYRSEKIAGKLNELGFTNVQNLYGGIFEWHNQSYDVVNLLGSTKEIHPYNAAWRVWIVKN